MQTLRPASTDPGSPRAPARDRQHLLLAGHVDAVALGRESLQSLTPRLPGSRILDGHFHASGVAVAVPKNRPAALAWVSAFIEEAKATGVVRRALDDAGLRNAAVAPPTAPR